MYIYTHGENLGDLLGCLGGPWGAFGRSWRVFGGHWGPEPKVIGGLWGAFWGRILGGLEGPNRNIFFGSGLLGVFGGSLGGLGGSLGGSWGVLRARTEKYVLARGSCSVRGRLEGFGPLDYDSCVAATQESRFLWCSNTRIITQTPNGSLAYTAVRNLSIASRA